MTGAADMFDHRAVLRRLVYGRSRREGSSVEGATRRQARLWPAAALAMVGFVTPASGRPLSEADLQRRAAVTGAWAAPDGHTLLLETQAPYREAGIFDDLRLVLLRLSRLWRIDTRGARPAAIAVSPGRGVLPLALSPSGRRLALARFEGRTLRLGVLAVSTGRVEWFDLKVRAPTTGPSVRWLDEARLAALAPIGDPEQTTFPSTLPGEIKLQRDRLEQSRGLPGEPRQAGSGIWARPAAPDTRLVVLDTRSGQRRFMASGEFDDLEPSPDGDVIALTGPAEPPALADRPRVTMADRNARRRLSLLDVRAGRLDHPCRRCDLAPTLLAWAPRGRRLLIFARRDGDAAWESGRYAIASPGSEGVTWLDAGDHVPAVERLPGTFFPVVRGGWEGDVPALRLRGAAGGTAGVFRLEGDRLAATAAPPQPRQLGGGVRAQVYPETRLTYARAPTEDAGVRLASTGGAHLLENRSARGVLTVSLERGGERRVLLTLNAHLAAVDPAEVHRLTRTSSLGTPAHDLLFLPKRSARPAPLIVVPYPGADHPNAPESLLVGSPPPEIDPNLLTAQGYAVLFPGLPRRPQDEPAERLTGDVLAAVDGAAAAGGIDARRLALWGQSFGGYAALVIAAESPRFRAVIAQSAPVDLISLYGAFPAEARARSDDPDPRDGMMGYLETGQGGMGAPPWRDPQRYMRNSPLFMAERISAPVLLIAGEQDFFPSSQSEEMFTALRRRDHDAQLLVFPGEGHTLTSPAARASYQAETLAFLSRALSAPVR